MAAIVDDPAVADVNRRGPHAVRAGRPARCERRADSCDRTLSCAYGRVASISPNGSSVATKISLRFSRPNRGEIDRQVVLVRHDEVDGGDVGTLSSTACPSRAACAGPTRCRARRSLEQRLSHGCQAGRSRRRRRVLPRRGQRRRENPVVGLGQRRVFVAQEAGERRTRRLQDHEISDAGA